MDFDISGDEMITAPLMEKHVDATQQNGRISARVSGKHVLLLLQPCVLTDLLCVKAASDRKYRPPEFGWDLCSLRSHNSIEKC